VSSFNNNSHKYTRNVDEIIIDTQMILNIESRFKKYDSHLSVLFSDISKISVQKIQNNLEGIVYYQVILIYIKGSIIKKKKFIINISIKNH
jgi:hypothetical protein